MSRSLYEEALADAKKLREIAEENAKRVVMEQIVTPKIKQLIEAELIGESHDEEEEGNILLDDSDEQNSVVSDPLANAISMPDETGAVTLDLGALQAATAGEEMSCDDDDEEIELTQETLKLLLPLLGKNTTNVSAIQEKVNILCNEAKQFKNKIMNENSKKDYTNDLSTIFSKVLNTYKYIQENLVENERENLEVQLEEVYKELETIKEFKEMAKKNLDEAALTIKVDGFLDDQLNLDELDVTLESDMEEEGAEASGDELDLSDDAVDAAPEAPVSDEEVKVETEMPFEMDENTVVEIDENMLRKEIARMKKLAEDKGHPVDILDDFGGGEELCDPFVDGEVTTEAYETEGDEEDEAVMEGKKSKDKKPAKKEVAKKKVQKEGSNNDLSMQLAEQKAANEKLSAKLQEQNLFSAKLLYVNKLLQNENLTPKQRSVAMERIDEARSLREVKLVYESVVKTVAQKSKKLSEGTVLGSSSRAVGKSGAPNLANEVNETFDRWQKLAGILKG